MTENDLLKSMEESLPPEARRISFQPVVRKAPEFKPIRIVARDPDFLAKVDTSAQDMEAALAGPPAPLSPGQVAAENNFRKLHGLDPLPKPEPEIDYGATLAKSAPAVMSQEEREAAYRSGRRSPVGHSVRKVDPETGEEHLVRVVTGYR